MYPSTCSIKWIMQSSAQHALRCIQQSLNSFSWFPIHRVYFPASTGHHSCNKLLRLRNSHGIFFWWRGGGGWFHLTGSARGWGVVEYQNTRNRLSNMPKINLKSCKIPKLRKPRYTLYPKLVVSELRSIAFSAPTPIVQRAMCRGSRQSKKLHRHFFLVSYQLPLVSADNGFSKRNESQLMQPLFSFFFGPTSLCTDATSPKKLGRERDFFWGGRGAVAVHRLRPTQCNGEQCPLPNARPR